MKSFFLTLIFALTLWNCSSNQIVNLRTSKDIVKNYYESGGYDQRVG